MGDEQTPQSDVIEDAIRQAERQLEAKLEALRMTALGDVSATRQETTDRVAQLRPTGSAPAGVEPGETVAWREAEGDDVTFAPIGDAAGSASADLYVPETPSPANDLPADDSYARSPGTVTGLTEVWDEEEEMDDAPAMFDEQQSFTSTAPTTGADVAPISRPRSPSSNGDPQDAHMRPRDTEWHRPEPVHASWTEPEVQPPSNVDLERSAIELAAQLMHTSGAHSAPNDEELRFWEQTRTALRQLRQLAGDIPDAVVNQLSGELQRTVTDELAAPNAALRSIQQQVQQGFPKTTERIEQAIRDAVAQPSDAISQVREELPAQLEQAGLRTHAAVREDLDRSAATVHASVQKDVAQLEQSIATNVTRMAHGVTEGVERVESDLNMLGENVARLERGVHGEFDRVESQLRTSIEKVEQLVHDELLEPTETIKKLDEELPARFTRVERTVIEQVQATQDDLAAELTNLVESNRAALDRIASLASTIDEDRARRSDDTELLIETFTSGWEGLAGAMRVLYEQSETNNSRITAIEERLAQIRDLEGAVDQTMGELRNQVRELQPAPVVVTVSHPEAEVRNTARGGWLPDSNR